MNSFEIILKNEKLRSYNRLSFLVLLFHFLFFTYYLLKAGAGLIILIGIFATAVAAFFLFFSIKENERPKLPAAISFLFLAIIWFMLMNYWLAAVLIILAFADIISMKKLTVLFFTEQIELPSFPKKIIKWNELNNVILKDRILTIDFKSDKLMQSEIAPESFGVDEKLFNGFCTQQLQNNG